MFETVSGLIAVRWGPSHVGDLVHRPQVFFGVAVAVEAPLHAERLILLYNVHRINSAMARDTSDTAANMRGMIEIGVIRQVVNANPMDGVASPVAFLDWEYAVLSILG